MISKLKVLNCIKLNTKSSFIEIKKAFVIISFNLYYLKYKSNKIKINIVAIILMSKTSMTRSFRNQFKFKKMKFMCPIKTNKWTRKKLILLLVNQIKRLLKKKFIMKSLRNIVRFQERKIFNKKITKNQMPLNFHLKLIQKMKKYSRQSSITSFKKIKIILSILVVNVHAWEKMDLKINANIIKRK